MSKQRLSASLQQRDQIIKTMIGLYCHGHHGTADDELCPACAELYYYAQKRTQRCQRSAEGKFCSSCPHPCYSTEHRNRIRAVMRYAGPRMVFRHPGMVIRHALGLRMSHRMR